MTTGKIISTTGIPYGEVIEHVCLSCKKVYTDNSRCSKRCVPCRMEYNRNTARKQAQAERAKRLALRGTE